MSAHQFDLVDRGIHRTLRIFHIRVHADQQFMYAIGKKKIGFHFGGFEFRSADEQHRQQHQDKDKAGFAMAMQNDQ